MSRSSAQKSYVSKKQQGQGLFEPERYATKNLPADDVVKLKQCFDIFDFDKSGSISPAQLMTSITALGLEKDAGKILQIVQSQSDAQQMDFPTFLGIFGFSGDDNNETSMQQLFQVFDKQKVGSFGVQEFAQVCESVGERFSAAQIQQMIEYADKDRDGRINYSQFVQVITKQYPQV